MPPAKRTTRTTKKTAKRTTKKRTVAKRSGPRTMSAAHKKALADGRNMSATVEKYLSALHVPKRRGRQISRETLERRLEAAQLRLRTTTGVAKLTAAQEVRDLRTKIAAVRNTTTTDIKSLESSFVKVAREFSERRGIGYGAWRDAGVPSPVLKRAGVKRTRG